MPAETETVVKWQLKYLGEHASEMSERELELVISFEDQFKRRGLLSERQMEVLEDIYKRH